MPYAITLRLDDTAAATVTGMWRTLAAAGVSDECLALGYPPHMTLAIFAEGADEAVLAAAARIAAARWRSRPVSLASVGLFPGTPATLFLAPVADADLLAAHADLLAETGQQGLDPHYRVRCWVPHVTLASDLTEPAAAVAALGSVTLPLMGRLVAMEVVRFRPVMILTRAILA